MSVDLSFDLELQVRAFLLASPDVFAIVRDRVYPAPAPQNVASPFVTFSRITAERNYTIYGPDRLTGALLQIDCWSDAPEYQGSYRIAKQLGIAVRQALHGFRGMMGPVRIQETDLEGERDLFEAQDHTRRVSFDFRFWYDEDEGAPVAPPLVLPLDKVPGAAFGYSTRKLRAGATSANSIRRASDGGNIGIGFDGIRYDDAAADAYLAGTTGALMAWSDQTGIHTAWQTTAALQPAFPKTGGIYAGEWTAQSAQLLSTPGAGGINDLFAAGGYVLFVVEAAALPAGTVALLTKGSWTIFLLATGGGSTNLFLLQKGSGGDGSWGTAPIVAPAGLHIVEIEYDSSAPANQPVVTLDGTLMPITTANDYSGIAIADAGPLEIGNSSLLGAAAFSGRILEAYAYKGIPSPADRATLRGDAKAWWQTP